MRRIIQLSVLALTFIVATACRKYIPLESNNNNQKVVASKTENTEENQPEEVNLNDYKELANLKDLSYTETGVHFQKEERLAVRVRTILSKINPKELLNLDYDDITPEELNEIKIATNKIVAGNSTETDKYNAIFKWIIKEIAYELVPENGSRDANRAGRILKNRKAVCQGYANLLKAMCYTQNIPAVITLGACYWQGKFIGDHAWNYVYVDGKWIVSDPTWHRQFKEVEEFEKHSYYLRPHTLAQNLSSNKWFDVAYRNELISFIKFKFAAPVAIKLPLSWQGLAIASLDPIKLIPKHIKSLQLSNNIISFGKEENNASGIVNMGYGKFIEQFGIADDNPVLEFADGVVYKAKGNKMGILYILDTQATIKLKYGEIFDKNIIINKANLKHLYFPTTATRIEAYAVEHCPLLETVYIPKGCHYEKKAFFDCNSSFKIVEF